MTLGKDKTDEAISYTSTARRILALDFEHPWRYRCPEGHSTWKPRANGYYCERCECVYAKLTDWKTKQEVTK